MPGPSTPVGTPELELSTTALAWGPLPNGLGGVKSFQVSNTGDGVMPQPQIGFELADAAFSVFLNRCEGDLAPGESCEARFQFLPTQVLESRATVAVDAGAAGRATLELSGAGLELGPLSINPDSASSAEFGFVALDTAATQTFVLSNPGEAPSGVFDILLNSPEFERMAPSEGDATACVPGTTDLAPGAACNIAIRFTPRVRGRVEASLVVRSGNAGACGLNVSGDGLGGGELGASAEWVDFGSVVRGLAASAELSIVNQGDLPLPLGAAFVRGANVADFSVVANPCGESLDGDASCALQLEFIPGDVGERSAELVVPAAAVEHVFALRGRGLQPGSLVLTAAGDASADFADVVVGSSRVQTFTLQNPGAQPSGALGAITAGNDFLPLPASQPADCQAGVTTLVNGESCTIRVSFQPTQRGVRSASLTIESPLTGTAGLQLIGRGVLPPDIAALTEVLDFGDVINEQSATGTVVITNEGDQPLPAPSFSFTGERSSAFSQQSNCTQPIEPGGRCEVAITFVPTTAGAYSVVLDLDAGIGGRTSVALRGRGLLPGSLRLEPAANNSAQFGDVNVGTARTQTFTLTNPGGVPSGAVSVSLVNNDGSGSFTRVRASGTDCTDGTTLVNGESCTIVVQFLPPSNLSYGANLVVRSPGAGNANANLGGRGVRSANLSRSETRDFGSRAVGDASSAGTFTRSWTVTNGGDLASAALTLEETNRGEFVITANACSGTLAPAASCTLSVEFRPAAVGRRSGQITLSAGGSQVVLSMSGTGFQRSGPGGTCNTAADCSGAANATACGNGANGTRICCDSACTGTCEFCNAQGQCVALQGGEACSGNDPRRGCFGRNRCLLPNGQTCNGDNANCGSGNCETAAGGGASVCCGANCMLGQECSANFQTCNASLGDLGDACGTSSDCSGGLACGQSIDGMGGRCCVSACSGRCQGCDATGSCVARPRLTACGTVGQVCINATTCDFPGCIVGSVLGQCKLGGG